MKIHENLFIHFIHCTSYIWFILLFLFIFISIHLFTVNFHSFVIHLPPLGLPTKLDSLICIQSFFSPVDLGPDVFHLLDFPPSWTHWFQILNRSISHPSALALTSSTAWTPTKFDSFINSFIQSFSFSPVGLGPDVFRRLDFHQVWLVNGEISLGVQTATRRWFQEPACTGRERRKDGMAENAEREENRN